MKRINIKDKNAISKIAQYRSKKYQSTDIELQNINLKKVNKLVGYELFKKNNVYVSSSTLFELMANPDNVNRHHFHGLTEFEILNTLENLCKPLDVYESYGNRYIILTGVLKDGYKIIAVIEVNAQLIENSHAKINKLITIYPKDKISKNMNKLNK